jgi:hypothetical protein
MYCYTNCTVCLIERCASAQSNIPRSCRPRMYRDWVHTLLFLSHIRELLFSSIIGKQIMVKIESSVKQTWENLSGPVFRIHCITHMSTNILLTYDMAQRRNMQEDKGIFKHEPTSNKTGHNKMRHLGFLTCLS